MKCGTMHNMKRKASNAMLGAAFSIFAVAAPCMASDGVPKAIARTDNGKRQRKG